MLPAQMEGSGREEEPRGEGNKVKDTGNRRTMAEVDESENKQKATADKRIKTCVSRQELTHCN